MFYKNSFYEKETTEEDIEEITEVGSEDDEKAFILENIAGLEIILEITEDEELEVKKFRIQLDVTTNRKKLREIENFMRKTLEEML